MTFDTISFSQYSKRNQFIFIWQDEWIDEKKWRNENEENEIWNSLFSSFLNIITIIKISHFIDFIKSEIGMKIERQKEKMWMKEKKMVEFIGR